MESASDFESMMRANGPRIYTLAMRLSGNLADGQDLAQETFIKAYQHWQDFRGDADVSTWLYRICVNCWKNRVRYERRRFFWKHFSLDGASKDDEDICWELPSGEPPVEAALEKEEDQAAVGAALVKLKPEDRALLILREIDGKSYEEIAALLEIPLGTVRSRLARARDKLVKLCTKKAL